MPHSMLSKWLEIIVVRNKELKTSRTPNEGWQSLTREHEHDMIKIIF